MITAVSDWDDFLEDQPWWQWRTQKAEVVVGPEGPWTRGEVDGLPELSQLLSAATVTPVTMDDQHYELLTWGPRNARRGWLCHPRILNDRQRPAVHPLHRAFWNVCGGIIAEFASPETWWTGESALTPETVDWDFAGALNAYSWMWDRNGLTIPVRAQDYYAIASEGNGTMTLIHRHNGQLVLFAPDPGPSAITPLPGCPESTLYTIDGVPDLESWIETCAWAWHNA